MNKLKNIGLSALAGTLVSLSAAQAGGVSVGGTMELTYVNLDSEEVTGNPLGTKKNISFSGGGEFANGWTYGILHVMNDGMSGISSSSMNINMGGIATLAYDSGTGGYGANTVDNVIPTAWEEIDYGLSNGLTDVGQVSKQKGVVNLTIKAPGTGTALSYSYAARMGAGHTADGSGSEGAETGWHGHDLTLDLLNIDTTWFGWRLGAAAEKVSHRNNCSNLIDPHDVTVVNGCTGDQTEDEYGGTTYTTLRLGPLSAGYQMSYIDNGSQVVTAVANNHVTQWGGAFTVGNFLSISYGKGTDKYQFNSDTAGKLQANGVSADNQDNGEKRTSEFEGGSVALNYGPLALKYALNQVTNPGGKAVTNDTHSEINLSMAF